MNPLLSNHQVINKNSLQMIKSILNGKNIKDFLLENFKSNNPTLNELFNLAKSGDISKLEEKAKEICKNNNINYDEEFNNFMNNFRQ